MSYDTEVVVIVLSIFIAIIFSLYGFIEFLIWICNNIRKSIEGKKMQINDEDELEKMYKLKSYFEQMGFTKTSIHDCVLKELDSEIKLLESSIFHALGKAVYEKKKGR